MATVYLRCVVVARGLGWGEGGGQDVKTVAGPMHDGGDGDGGGPHGCQS